MFVTLIISPKIDWVDEVEGKVWLVDSIGALSGFLVVACELKIIHFFLSKLLDRFLFYHIQFIRQVVVINGVCMLRSACWTHFINRIRSCWRFLTTSILLLFSPINRSQILWLVLWWLRSLVSSILDLETERFLLIHDLDSDWFRLWWKYYTFTLGLLVRFSACPLSPLYLHYCTWMVSFVLDSSLENWSWFQNWSLGHHNIISKYRELLFSCGCQIWPWSWALPRLIVLFRVMMWLLFLLCLILLELVQVADQILDPLVMQLFALFIDLRMESMLSLFQNLLLHLHWYLILLSLLSPRLIPLLKCLRQLRWYVSIFGGSDRWSVAYNRKLWLKCAFLFSFFLDLSFKPNFVFLFVLMPVQEPVLDCFHLLKGRELLLFPENLRTTSSLRKPKPTVVVIKAYDLRLKQTFLLLLLSSAHVCLPPLFFSSLFLVFQPLLVPFINS